MDPRALTTDPISPGKGWRVKDRGGVKEVTLVKGWEPPNEGQPLFGVGEDPWNWNPLEAAWSGLEQVGRFVGETVPQAIGDAAQRFTQPQPEATAFPEGVYYPEGSWQQDVLTGRVPQRSEPTAEQGMAALDVSVPITTALGKAGVPGHEDAGFSAGPLEVGPREAIGFAAGMALDPLSGAAKARYAPTFFSGLRRMLDQLNWNRMPADQLARTISGKVKKDELKWTGFEDLLAQRAAEGKPITKQEALAFLDQNEVKVEEVIHGKPKSLSWYNYGLGWESDDGQFKIRRDQDSEGLFRIFRPNSYGHPWGIGHKTLEEAQEKAQDLAASRGARWREYKVPGGKNYQELLLTVPSRRGEIPPNYSTYAQEKYGYTQDKVESTWEDYNDPVFREWKTAHDRAWGNDDYYSPHWEEPNVLAHIRYDDRIDFDGKKMLFINELQSDWHQAGQKAGYRKIGETPQGGGDPPEGPFAGDWRELALRRTLREAAEKGYERLGWSSGDVAIYYSTGGAQDLTEKQRAGLLDHYDVKLPSLAKKIGKRYNAQVGRTSVFGYAFPDAETFDAHYIEITPELRRAVLDEGQPLFGVGQDDEPGGQIVPYSPGMLSVMRAQPFAPPVGSPTLWPPLTHESTRRMNAWSEVGVGEDGDGWDIPGMVNRRIANEARGWQNPLDLLLGATQLGIEGVSNVARYPAGVLKGLGDIAVGAAQPGEEDILSPGGAMEQFSELPGVAQFGFDVAVPYGGMAKLGGKVLSKALKIPGATQFAPVVSPLGGTMPSAVEKIVTSPLGQSIARKAPWAAPAGLGVAGVLSTPEVNPETGQPFNPVERGMEALERGMLGVVAGLLAVPVLGSAVSLARKTPTYIDVPERFSPQLTQILTNMNQSRAIQNWGTEVPVFWPGGWWGYQRDRLRAQFTDRLGPLQTLQRRVEEKEGYHPRAPQMTEPQVPKGAERAASPDWSSPTLGEPSFGKAPGAGKLEHEDKFYDLARLTAGLSGEVGEHYEKLSREALRYQKMPSPISTSKALVRLGDEPGWPKPEGMVEWGLKNDQDMNLFDVYSELGARWDRAKRGIDKNVNEQNMLDSWREYIDKEIIPTQGPHAMARYEETLKRLNRSRRYLYDAVEKSGMLEPGETARLFDGPDSRSYYLAWRDVGKTVDDWGKVKHGDPLFVRHDVVEREREASQYATATLGNLLDHDAKMLSAAGRNRVGQAFLRAAERDWEGLGQMVRPWFKEDAHSVPSGWALWPIFNEGRAETYIVPRFLRDTLAVVDEPQMDMFTKAMGTFTSRLFRAGVTTYALTFLTRNPIRDFFTTAQNYERPGMFVREYLGAWGDVLREGPLRRLFGGKPGNVSDLYASRGGQGAFFEQGAGMPNPTDVIFGKSVGLGKVADLFKGLNQLSELPARVAVFRAEKRMGKSAEEAALTARKMVVDFSKGGHALRALNMWFPLVNARVQGDLQSWDSLSKDPAGFAARTGLETIPWLASYAWNRAQYSDLYDKIPQEILDRNMVMITGTYIDPKDNKEYPIYVKLPMNNVQIALFTPLRQMLDEVTHTSAYGQPLEAHQRTARSDARMWTELLANLMPIDAKADELDPPGLMMALVAGQPLAGMAAQLYANQDHFFGRPIVDPAVQRLPKRYQYNERTSQTSRAVADWLQTHGLPESWHYAPAELDFIARSLGGTAAMGVVGSLDLILEKLGVHPPEPQSPEDLGISPDADPALWQQHLQQLTVPDTRPAIAKVLSAWVGAGGGRLTGTSKAGQMTPRDQRTWQDTTGFFDDYNTWKATNYYPDRNEALYGHSEEWTHGKIQDEYFRLTDRKSQTQRALMMKYPNALRDPMDRRSFTERMPGIPLGAEYSAALASLPEGINVGELANRYWNPTDVQGMPIDLPLLNPVDQQRARSMELRRMAGELTQATGQPVDSRVLRDAITAFTRGVELPALLLPAAHVEEWATRYQFPQGLKPEQVQGDTLRDLRRLEITRIARESKILDFLREEWASDPTKEREPTQRDAEDYVLERINTYFRSPEESDPMSISIEKALNISARLKDPVQFPRYIDRSGNAIGTPEDWARWDAELDTLKGHPRKKWSQTARAYDTARRLGEVVRLEALYSDPDYVYYQRFFGVGRTMTPAMWEKFQSGEFPKYKQGTPQEWIQMDGLIAIYRTLPEGDPLKRRLKSRAQRYYKLATEGWRGFLQLSELSGERQQLNLETLGDIYEERTGGEEAE